MNIYEKLQIIQGKLKVPKDLYNSFGKYSYRSAESILESVKPLLQEVKAVLTVSDEIKQIGDRIYVESTATLIDTEKGEKIEISALAREDENKKGQDSAQTTGSTSSYARKYALNGLFCIDDTKDADATNQHGKGPVQKPQTKPVPPTAPPQQEHKLPTNLIKALHAIRTKNGVDEEHFKSGIGKALHRKITSLHELTEVEAKSIIKSLGDK